MDQFREQQRKMHQKTFQLILLRSPVVPLQFPTLQCLRKKHSRHHQRRLPRLTIHVRFPRVKKGPSHHLGNLERSEGPQLTSYRVQKSLSLLRAQIQLVLHRAIIHKLTLLRRASLIPSHLPVPGLRLRLQHQRNQLLKGQLRMIPLTLIQLIQYLLPTVINGRKISLLPNDEHFKIISTHNTLTRRQQHHKRLLEQFARQWRLEYLLSLRERPTTKSANGNPATVRVGNIVILKNESTSRAFWKLAKVEELLPGNDGKIRAAIVRVPRINGKSQLLKRVVQHLIPIEVQAESTDNQLPGDSSVPLQGSQPVVNSNPPTGRPRRNAAVRGEILRRELLRL